MITLLFLIADFCLVSFYLQAPSQRLKPYYEKEIRAFGYIEPLSFKQADDKASFVLACEAVYIGDQRIAYRDKLRIHQSFGKKSERESARPASLAAGGVPKAGRVMLRGTLQELRSFANPGGFNMESYNWVQGLGGMVRKAQVQVISTEPRWLDYFALLNLQLRERVESATGKSAPLLCGMVLGGSSDLSNETRESFSANGLSHLLSVSGTHFILLASFLKLLLRVLGVRNKSYILLAVLTAYAGLCGFKPPVLRALSTSAVLIWGQGREAARARIFCVLIMLALLYKPIWILDLGFQLSFGAAAGLLWLLPKIKLKLEALLGFAPLLNEGVAVTLAAQLATLPIIIGNFYTVSLISIISNILLVPVLELTTIFTLIGTLLSSFVSPVGNMFLQAAAWLAEQILLQASWLRSLPFSLLVVGSLPVFCGVLYYAMLVIWLDLPFALILSKLQRQVALVMSGLIIACCYGWRQWLPMPTTIYFLDVGQGDAAVIVSPEHRVAVIDTGGLPSFDTGARILTPFLHSLGKNEIEIFVPSHGDKDHIGGSTGLARNLRIRQIILPMEEMNEDNLLLYKDLLEKAKSSEILYANNIKEIQLGGSVLRPVAVSNFKQKGNDASTVVELEDRKTGYRALFTGDMSSKREAKLSNLKQYDVLKVGHHGSKSSTSEAFLEQIRPKLAVISCDLNNMYGHPHKAVLERLRDAGAVVARTDLQGCIKVEFTEEGIKWGGYRK